MLPTLLQHASISSMHQIVLLQ